MRRLIMFRILLSPAMLRFVMPALALVVASCVGSTEPAMGVAGTVVVAGESDPAWAALGKNCSVESPVYGVPGRHRHLLPPYSHGTMRTSDDDLVEFARTAPGGFAGVYSTGGLELTMLLVDTLRFADAAAAYSARFDSSRPVIAAIPARWDFAQLGEWYGLFTNLLWRPGVFSGRIDERKNRIEFRLTHEVVPEVERLLRDLDVPCYLVALYPGQPPVFFEQRHDTRDQPLSRANPWLTGQESYSGRP